MNQLEFTFEKPSWERIFEQLHDGDTLDAVRFLTLMESQSEDELEEAFALLEEKDILLDITQLGVVADSAETAVRLRYEKELVAKNTLLQDLEPNHPLRLYLEEIAALPAYADVQLLADAYLQGDDTVVAQLTNLMLSRVAEESFALAGRGVLLLDLLQEGGLGLWQAILGYQGGDFEAYCTRCIKKVLHKALVLQAREFGVGQRMRQAMEDYRAVDERLLGDLGRNPTLEEIALELHMTVQETAAVAEMLEIARRMYRAKAEPEPEEEELAETQAVEDTAYFQMRQRISELLSTLDELDAQILSSRFGLESGLPLSAAETGKKLGLTPNEVTAREAAALIKLRNNETKEV